MPLLVVFVLQIVEAFVLLGYDAKAAEDAQIQRQWSQQAGRPGLDLWPVLTRPA